MQAKAAVKSAINEPLEEAIGPDVLLLAVGCDVSLATRITYEKHAAEANIPAPMRWTASQLKMLYADHPDLLFGFYGISLARKKHSRRRRRETWRDHHNPNLIVRFIDDDAYPDIEKSKVELREHKSEELPRLTDTQLQKSCLLGTFRFRNIVEIDKEGDEFYAHAHSRFCRFANGTPYELIVYKRERWAQVQAKKISSSACQPPPTRRASGS